MSSRWCAVQEGQEAHLELQLGVADHLEQVGAKGGRDVRRRVAAQLREGAAVQLSDDLRPRTMTHSDDPMKDCTFQPRM